MSFNMTVPEIRAYWFVRDKTIAELLRDGHNREEVAALFGVPTPGPLRQFKERLRDVLWGLSAPFHAGEYRRAWQSRMRLHRDGSIHPLPVKPPEPILSDPSVPEWKRKLMEIIGE